MPVLILALASLAFFVVTVVLIGLAEAAESRERLRRGAAHRAPPPALLSITQAFDPTYAMLWETQLEALRLVNSRGRRGVSAYRLLPWFVKACHCFPEIYDGCCFEQWLAFLAESGLITWQDGRVVLTAQGEEFLKYRFTTDALVGA